MGGTSPRAAGAAGSSATPLWGSRRWPCTCDLGGREGYWCAGRVTGVQGLLGWGRVYKGEKTSVRYLV